MQKSDMTPPVLICFVLPTFPQNQGGDFLNPQIFAYTNQLVFPLTRHGKTQNVASIC